MGKNVFSCLKHCFSHNISNTIWTRTIILGRWIKGQQDYSYLKLSIYNNSVTKMTWPFFFSTFREIFINQIHPTVLQDSVYTDIFHAYSEKNNLTFKHTFLCNYIIIINVRRKFNLRARDPGEWWVAFSAWSSPGAAWAARHFRHSLVEHIHRHHGIWRSFEFVFHKVYQMKWKKCI